MEGQRADKVLRLVSLLIVEDLRKHYGAQDVLRGVTFQIDPGEKVGLVGRNGGGKSTLLRIIEGLEQPDGGSVTIAKGARLGHVPQIPRFVAGQTVLDYVESGLVEARAIERELGLITERMGATEGVELDRLVRRHDELQHRLEQIGGWDLSHVIGAVLGGIGLSETFWEREASSLSGGEKSRTALARELVAGHDVLLLDEPTNHLDLRGIEWIEAWLRELKSAVLIVSHDRRLLTNSVDRILDLERGTLRSFPGNYPKYLQVKAERFESERRAFEVQQDFVRKEEEFIKRHMGSQRTAEAKGRQKKLENLARLHEPYDDVRKPAIPPPKVERGGELVLETRALCGGYGERVLFEDLDLRIGRGQRLGIVGKNGAGKTTLLKLLAGRTRPLAGSIDFGHKALCGYYDQDTSELREDNDSMTEMRRVKPDWTDLECRSHLARFLFRGLEVEKQVKNLSGGERARLCLAKLLATPITWLAMDEPTNHLDLAARTSLEEMLGGFDGALVCISHDREFLDGLCTHILEVEDGAARLYTGNYSAYRARKLEADAELAAERDNARKSAPKPAPKPADPPPQKPAPSGKVRNPWAFEKLEQRIMALEAELETLNDSLLTEDVYKSAPKSREVQTRIAEIQRDLDEANEQWMNWQ
ncbi:MAG: ABC-F family ATP-binding cassette domain-containing protein [Planctomycetes bacterium]|nr:ABC-F family ATP-binding cassette domain-containing protein [Planctomycetota bacterium]